MREREVVKPDWWRLFDKCSNCNKKIWVSEVLANADGEFIFKTTCFQCGLAECYQFPAKHIEVMCFDLDFMAFAKIKN